MKVSGVCKWTLLAQNDSAVAVLVQEPGNFDVDGCDNKSTCDINYSININLSTLSFPGIWSTKLAFMA